MRSPSDVQALTVLVADDDEQARRLTCRILGHRGMRCLQAADGGEAADLARTARPDVVLLDVHMPISGAEGLRRLRGDHRTALIPVIFVTGDPRPAVVVDHLRQGADDYVTKPFTPDELEARIIVAHRRRGMLGSVSPLTGLPGNAILTAEIEQRLAHDEPFALLHVDVDDFKPYNDRYGYVAGDRVLTLVADLMRGIADASDDDRMLLAHIGGDDFAILARDEAADVIATRLVESFASRRDALHDPQDVAAGSYRATDRAGTQRDVPLLALSVGIVSSARRTFTAAVEMADAAAEMKAVAKRTPGPSVARDRRHTASALKPCDRLRVVTPDR